MKPTLLNLTILAGCLLSNRLWADDQSAGDASRGVARISFLSGDVSVRRGDSGDAAFAAFDGVKRRIAEFPAAWYYITRSTNLVKEENARHRFRKRYLSPVVRKNSS